MKASFSFIKLCLLSCLFVFSCKNNKKEQINLQDAETEEVKKTDNYIEIVTNVMDFQSVDTIPSGWNTLRYINKSTEPHFVLIDDYPEGKTLDTVKTRVMPPFDKGMAFIMEGKMDEAISAFGALPKWFPEVKFVGGTGLISPRMTATTTVKLEPGLHIIECYVKMANGMFHASMGMAKEIYVLEEDSGNQPPNADVNMTISSTEGITYADNITAGEHIFSVYFKDQIVHEHFLGHDVNLVKLEDNANIEELEAWMNWMNPTGLITPMPEGVTFLGGVNNALEGSTQYFYANLKPGKYAFIAEVPNASSKNMLKMFEVTD